MSKRIACTDGIWDDTANNTAVLKLFLHNCRKVSMTTRNSSSAAKGSA